MTFKYNIVSLRLSTELDVVSAYKTTNHLAEMVGMTSTERTKFSTAVFEICRNAFIYAGGGNIDLGITDIRKSWFFIAVVRDTGKGIRAIDKILAGQSRGMGITNAKKLVDEFFIESSINGTEVKLTKKLNTSHKAITEQIIHAWRDRFSNQVPASPYEEIKNQNARLIEMTEALKEKNEQAHRQINEIKRLNKKLTDYNTEVKGLAQELGQKNAMLQKMNDTLEDYAYMVSHDLKSPLKNMEGLANLIVETNRKGKTIDDKFTKMMLGQVQRMDKLINGILSQARAGKDTVERTRIDTFVLLQETISTLDVPDLFKIELAPDLPVIFAEEVYFQQVFMNLISNAIKYHDKEEGCIMIGYERRNGMHQFSVADDGPGIPEEQKEKIFKLFHTLHNKHVTNSTGIGLSIVQKIVEGKGGRIWVESAGRGSRFIFTWPELREAKT